MESFSNILTEAIYPDYSSKFLFKNIILKFSAVAIFYIVGIIFYSIVEDWTIVDSIYFITSSISTVGYGDLKPTTNLSRIFTIVVICIGMTTIFSIVENIVKGTIYQAETNAIRSYNYDSKTKISYRFKIILLIVTIWFCITFGALFYHLAEGWDFIEAFYFCVITTATVGYGDLAPHHRGSRIFTTFYIITSVAVTTFCLSEIFATVFERETSIAVVKSRSRERLGAGYGSLDRLSAPPPRQPPPQPQLQQAAVAVLSLRLPSGAWSQRAFSSRVELRDWAEQCCRQHRGGGSDPSQSTPSTLQLGGSAGACEGDWLLAGGAGSGPQRQPRRAHPVAPQRRRRPGVQLRRVRYASSAAAAEKQRAVAAQGR